MKEAGGNRGQGVERIPAELPEKQRRHSSHRKVQGKDCDHWYLRNVRNSIVRSWSRRSIVRFGADSLPSVTNSFGGLLSAQRHAAEYSRAVGGYHSGYEHCRRPRGHATVVGTGIREPVSHKGRILAWAAWDWGSAAFNAVMTTFVFTVYLTSKAFGGEDQASAVLGAALAIAGAGRCPAGPGHRAAVGHRRAAQAVAGGQHGRRRAPDRAVLLCLPAAGLPAPRRHADCAGQCLLRIRRGQLQRHARPDLHPAEHRQGQRLRLGNGVSRRHRGAADCAPAVCPAQLRLVWRLHRGQPQHPAGGSVLRPVVLRLRPARTVRRAGAARAAQGAPAWASWPPTACSSAASRRSTGPARTPSTSCSRAPSSGTGWPPSSPSAAMIAAGTFGFELKDVIFFAIFGNIVAAAGRHARRLPG